MAEPRRPLACSILFADLVGASLRPDDEQVRDKQALNARIALALRGTPAPARLALDAGDGVAICFALPAQAALRVALGLQRLLCDGARPLQARMGLHFGPVRVVPDVNERPNVVGDGINVARRIMDFAQPGQLLASDEFRLATGVSDQEAAHTFRFLGPFADKHGRLHQVHAVRSAAKAAAAPPSTASSVHVPVRRMLGASRPLSRDQLARLENMLCQRIGPIGKLVLRQQVAQGLDSEDLVEALALEISMRPQRDAFRREALTELMPAPISAY
jgi:class 3 adenylate cyclase